MALPPLFVPQSLTTIPFLKSDGVQRHDLSIDEPGVFYDDSAHEAITAHFPEITQVTDYLITGTFNSTATWTLTVTPVLTQSGASAASHGMEALSVSFVAVSKTAAEVIAGLIAAIATAATATTLGTLSSWSRIGSYVTAIVSPASTSKIRLTARSSGATFTAAITSTTAGDSYTTTAITAPVTDNAKVGFYMALDTDQGTAGYDKQGKPYLKKITSSTAAADIIGPVSFGADTKEVAQGFAYREYEPGNVPIALYGHITAYCEAALAFASGPEAVYVRHTDAGDYLAGMAADATRAAVGATANLWTGTPTSANDTVFTMTIAFGTVVEQLSYLSDVSSSATEIATGLRAELAKYTGAGGSLYGLTGSGTSTFIITGPADGRGFTPVNTGVGVVDWVETDAEVSTHTLLTRGDKFLAPTTRIGSAKVDVPHSNA